MKPTQTPKMSPSERAEMVGLVHRMSWPDSVGYRVDEVNGNVYVTVSEGGNPSAGCEVVAFTAAEHWWAVRDRLIGACLRAVNGGLSPLQAIGIPADTSGRG